MSADVTTAADTFRRMTELFQCPGCVCGSDANCGKYKRAEGMNSCGSHVLGTILFPVGNFALGLPKGFCRPGPSDDPTRHGRSKNKIDIRFHAKDAPFGWNDLNVPVWALERDGYLFVRTYQPRTNQAFVDVVEGGTLALVPRAIDVGKFYDEID